MKRRRNGAFSVALDKAQRIVSLCERNGLKPSRLLEVGAGDGAILGSLSEKSFCNEMHLSSSRNRGSISSSRRCYNTSITSGPCCAKL